ncbi:MAG: 2-oxo acid dehydrogenase subunit E2, partial [Armatimonadetes bacterium]|nr:2-oxo acid dehydrogenase subunit E2 [Armatimonadota bacterium]
LCGLSLPGTDIEVSRMRRAIARRTVQSKQTVPHFYLITAVEMDRAMQLLEELNEMYPDQKLTVNDLVVKSCALALAEFPDVNASYTPDDRIRRYEAINIGIAVGTENGLTIPVISDCRDKTLRQIADTAKELIRKARSGALKPEEFSGGTFSISNLGMYGIEEFSAIISPPEAAILAVGAIAKEAVPDESDRISIKRRMRLTISCDHRVVDGVLGARFLNAVKRYLEKPAHLTIE